MKNLLIITLILFLSSCAASKFVQKEDVNAFEFSRTSCYGKCPAYDVRIKNDSIFYYGKIYVEKKGAYKATGGKELFKKLIAEAQQTKFFDMPNFFPPSGSVIPDLPSAKIRFVTKSKVKEVNYNHEGPPNLIKFLAYIDAQLDAVNWVKVQK